MIKTIRNTVLAGWLIFISSTVNAALIQAFQGTGTYGIEVAAVGIGALPSVSSAVDGTLNLSVLPAGFTVVQAYLYAHDINHFGNMTGTFNGAPLLGGTSVSAYANDSAFTTLNTFRWDVTAQIITGISNYSWSFTEVLDQFNNQGASIGMTTLALVYSHPNLQTSTATIYDGMTYVGNTHPETEILNMTGLTAGLAAINIATFQDDNSTPPSSTGEVISFNGSVIGGSLDQNLTLNGSLNQLAGVAVAGTNDLRIQTQSDEFGWTLATTLVTATVVPVPASVWLFASALVGLLGVKKHKLKIKKSHILG